MASMDEHFILLKGEEQKVFFEDESLTDSELVYLFADVRKFEEKDQAETLPSKGKVAALIKFFESLKYGTATNELARPVRNSSSKIAPNKESTNMKDVELKDQMEISSAESTSIHPQTLRTQPVIGAASSLSDFAASITKSTNPFTPLTKSMPNLRMGYNSKDTTTPQDGLWVFVVAAFCYALLKFVLIFTSMD